MICGSSASTAPSATGRWRSAFRCRVSSPARPFSFASVSARRKSAVSCVVNALVEATPISTPACVRNCSRVMRISAVEALGRAAAARARRDPGPGRELLRRVLWLMNDESGGLLWHGPQVLGAVLAGVPALCGEFLEVLASFLEE